MSTVFAHHMARSMAAKSMAAKSMAARAPKNCKEVLSRESQIKYAQIVNAARMRPNKPGVGASLLISAAASIISVNFIHPIELVKTRIQVTGLPLFSTIRGLVRTEGYRALYKGIKPAWLREGSYTALKMGMYAPTRDFIAGTNRQATPLEVRFGNIGYNLEWNGHA